MRSTHNPHSANFPGVSGFTLVELLVSSTILGLTVSAVAFMIINSSELRVGNDHNRQARVIAQEELEDTNHHFFRYDGMLGLENLAINLDQGETYSTVANRNLTIVPGNFLISALMPTVTVPYKALASTVTWTENGVTKSVTLTKWITPVR